MKVKISLYMAIMLNTIAIPIIHSATVMWALVITCIAPFSHANLGCYGYPIGTCLIDYDVHIGV